MFVGHVISIVNGGAEAVMVVEPSTYGGMGVELPPYSTVYVYANFGGAVDGDRFKVTGEDIGNVTYTTALGANATVHGFRGRVIKLYPGDRG